MPSSDTQVGRLVGGRYQLDERIGEGGMGSVWRATDLTLQRSVAVKLLFSGDERERDLRVDRFLREARIAAAVQHRNVVHIVDFGSTDEGRPYMVMEHLEGETLAERLARKPAPTVAEVVDWVAEALRGLAAAHEAGIVHRDMKPENVFLVKDGDGDYPKILDFGISRSLQPDSGPSSALTTKEGFLIGTPQYMSPEQARGLRDIDHTSDLYSIGVILYEAFTGRLPFDAEHVGDLIIRIAGGGAFDVDDLRPEIGRPLAEVVRRSMELVRTERYGDAREMRNALIEALEASDEEAGALAARSRLRPVTPEPTGDLASDASTSGATLKAKGTPSDEKRNSADALAATLPARPTPAEIAPPANSIGTPYAWTVDREKAIPRKRGGGRVLAVLAALAVLGGGGWYLTLQGDDAVPEAETASAAAPAAAGEPPSVEPAAGPLGEPVEEPPAEEPSTVAVTLAGLPEDATVRLDGEPTEDRPLTLPADDAEHEIEVTAPGKQPWTVTHLASADGSYRVELQDEPTRPRARPTGMRTRREPMAMRPGRMTSGAPTTLRELDY